MLVCPLATHSNTLWLTADQTSYGRRFLWALGLSLGLHLALVLSFFEYETKSNPIIPMSLGAPDLPVHVKLITQNAQQASEKLVGKKQTEIIPAVDKKELTAKPKQEDQTGQNSINAQASTTERSAIDGLAETVTVNSAPRFRVPPGRPAYPVQAQRRGQEGRVTLAVTVDAKGKTVQINIIHSSGFALLDKAALEAVRKWQLMPHTINGQNVQALFTVPVDFALTWLD